MLRSGGSLGAGWVAKKGEGGFRLEGRSKEISLREVAAEGTEPIELRCFFDSLGDNLAIEFAGEQTDEFDDVVGGAVGLHAGDESAVDLPNIYSKLPKYAQRERAATKVVDGDRDLQTFELPENVSRQVWSGHSDALRYAELKTAGAQRELAKTGFDTVQK